jgi:adenosylcobinamide-phosphate synthase
VAYAAIGAGLGALSARGARSTAVVVAVCAAGRQLRDTAGDIERMLAAGDLEQARAALPALVGRDPSRLDAPGVAAAVIESVAENMVDAVFAPAFWAVVAGAPGAGVHRALNTMDAMVGRRDARYERFGWAAARADDLANLVPARLFATAVAAVRPARAAAVVATVRADARRHPSPNAGVAEAAMAAALGRELGGPLRYGDTDEDRPRLGVGPRPTTGDVREAIRIAEHTELALIGALSAGAALGALRRRRSR